MPSVPVESKPKDEPTGCRIEILDDGTYLLTLENRNYDLNKEYSFNNLDDMFQEIQDYLPEEKASSSDEQDVSPKKKKAREMASQITQGD